MSGALSIGVSGEMVKFKSGRSEMKEIVRAVSPNSRETAFPKTGAATEFLPI